MAICIVDDCEKKTIARSLCREHYRKDRLGWGPCSVEGCARESTGGYCRVHRRALNRYGFIPTREEETDAWKMENIGPCLIEGCDKPQTFARTGICKSHRDRATRYQISDERFIQLLSVRSCEICGATDRTLVVDHDHLHDNDHEGKPWKMCETCIRGVLCVNCNSMLGMVNDNLELLEAAAKYLRRNGLDEIA